MTAVVATLRVLLAAWLCTFAASALALDANTATPEELETIRGIGPALSARIVEERDRKPFEDLEDLRARVRGIGETNLRKMRDAGLAVGSSGRVQTIAGQQNTAHAVPGGADAAPRVQLFVGKPHGDPQRGAHSGSPPGSKRARAAAAR